MGKLNNFIGIRQKEISQKVYQETKCGVRTCCFECVRRFVCREFEGVCECDTRETYQNCPQIIQEQRDRE